MKKFEYAYYEKLEDREVGIILSPNMSIYTTCKNLKIEVSADEESEEETELLRILPKTDPLCSEINVLNALGSFGWELVSTNLGKKRGCYYFKREIL